jgi:hypothetical protein
MDLMMLLRILGTAIIAFLACGAIITIWMIP